MQLVCSAQRRSIPLKRILYPRRNRYESRFVSNSTAPVELHYEKTELPGKNLSIGPLVICHGLFGSKQNWRSLSKTFASRLGCPVYSLDLRNHGTSPHASPMIYTAMADDIVHFCQTHDLSNISLLGHSMGGKAVMSVALSPRLPQNLLSKLIVADIAPARGALSSDFREYTYAMSRIEHGQVKSRKEADEILAEIEPDTSIRAFLLTNITFDRDSGFVRFRIPVDLIKDSLEHLGDFPYDTQDDRQWNGQTLVIKGEKSKYINKHNTPLVQHFFPNSEIKSLDTGHWVHAERPHEFVELVTNFIKN